MHSVPRQTAAIKRCLARPMTNARWQLGCLYLPPRNMVHADLARSVGVCGTLGSLPHSSPLLLHPCYHCSVLFFPLQQGINGGTEQGQSRYRRPAPTNAPLKAVPSPHQRHTENGGIEPSLKRVPADPEKIAYIRLRDEDQRGFPDRVVALSKKAGDLLQGAELRKRLDAIGKARRYEACVREESRRHRTYVGKKQTDDLSDANECAGYFSEDSVSYLTNSGIDPYIATRQRRHTEKPVAAPPAVGFRRMLRSRSGWRARRRAILR